MRVNYAIVFVSDMSRSVAFYRDMLGLPLRFESPAWSEFTTEGATLALHRTVDAASGVESHQGEPAGRCRPGLQVPNLNAFHERMVEHHVGCIQEPTAVFGSRVAQYLDPDGLVISVGEEGTGH
jgi:lactoylglutathione lyase